MSYFPEFNHEFIRVWVDKTTELNSLMGNLVCKEKFGEFEYVKGPLSYSMEKGILIVFDNFQEISHELLTGLRVISS